MKLSEIVPGIAIKPAFESSTTLRAWRLRDKAVSELSQGELAFCLRQGIATQQVAQRALPMAVEQPLIEVEFYPGDLVAALIAAADAGRLTTSQSAEVRNICSDISAAFETLEKTVIPAARAYVERYDSGA